MLIVALVQVVSTTSITKTPCETTELAQELLSPKAREQPFVGKEETWCMLLSDGLFGQQMVWGV